jgi:hypothetical protein
MCLTKVVTTYVKPSGLIVDGWKEFIGSGSSMKFPNYGGSVALDVWLRADEIRPTMDITASDGKKYKSGFHAYADEQGKPSYCQRVYLRSITYAGEEGGRKCVIAHEMYVPSNPNAWPPLAGMLPRKKLVDRIRGAGK